MASAQAQAQPSGNTSQKVTQLRKRGWCLTIFDENEIKKFNEIECQYRVCGIEICPATGRKHGQAFIYFKNPRLFNGVKRIFPTAHIEPQYGSNSQASAYCKKDGAFIEYGELPNDNGITNTVRDLKKLEKDDVPAKYYSVWERVRSRKIKIDDDYKKMFVVYISGPSGVGKSLRAKEILREHGFDEFDKIKRDGDFWHGASDEGGAAIYDDFRCSHMKPSEFINLIDYNKHYMNVKGGSVLNNYDTIIITSVENLDSIYLNVPDEPRRQWERRITENIILSEEKILDEHL